MQDLKPTLHSDGSQSYHIPLDEDEPLSISPDMEDTFVWSMKIPRFLLELWERVEEAGVELGRIYIDQSSVCAPHIYPAHALVWSSLSLQCGLG